MSSKGKSECLILLNSTTLKAGMFLPESKGQFNFRIAGENDLLAVSVWYGLFCYEKSEIVAQNNFDFSADGLQTKHPVGWKMNTLFIRRVY